MAGGDFSEPRLIHSPGFIHLCNDRSTEPSEWAFISCGIDGDFWLWGKEDLEEADYTPKMIGGRTHSAIAWHGLNVYVGHTFTDPHSGIEKAFVSKMELKDDAVSLPLASFSLDVTTIDVSVSGSLLAVGAIDHLVKLIRVEDGDFTRLEFEGQVLCVSFDPKEEFLAVTASDGRLSVCGLSMDKSAVFTTRLCSRITDIDTTKSRLQVCWSPNGDFLFAPSTGIIKKFKRDFVSQPVSLALKDSLDEIYSVCCASPCGRFIAACSLSGLISVWNTLDNSLITSSKYTRDGVPKVICSMVWHTAVEGTLVFADVDEHICSLNCTRELLTAKEGDANFACDIDDNDTRFSADVGEIKRAFGYNEDGSLIEDFVPSLVEEEKLRVNIDANYTKPYQPPVLPKGFISGSTPVPLCERYLKWNRFGVITCYVADSENSIEISWHDVSVHPSMNIDNMSSNYCLGDISNEIVVLAAQGDKEVQSELYAIYIAAFDQASREWNISMTLGEVIEDVAVGTDFVAVATSARCFRTFSLAGIQRIVVSFPGVLVTMCAANDLALATYDGGYFFERGVESAQYNVTVRVYKVNSRIWFKNSCLVKPVSVAVGQGANCLRLLTKACFWIPIYDFSIILKSKSDAIWLITVVETPEPEIRYVYCKGTKFPLIASRPVPLSAKWLIPLCNLESEKSKLEGNLLLMELLQSVFENNTSPSLSAELQKLSIEYAKDVVRLFALSCKADRECRAVELAWLAPNSQVLQSLCNYAAKTRHRLLSDKVADIGRQCDEALLEVNDSKTLRTNALTFKKSVKSEHQAVGEVDTAFEIKNLNENECAEASNKVSSSSVDSISTSHLDRTWANSSSYSAPVSSNKAVNPFKRKMADTVASEKQNLFDSLATPERRALPFSNVSSNKKSRQSEFTPKQSLLQFSAQNPEKDKKTGFQLWLSSSEKILKQEYEGDEEDFLKFATRKYRSLDEFEKQKWNDAAGS